MVQGFLQGPACAVSLKKETKLKNCKKIKDFFARKKNHAFCRTDQNLKFGYKSMNKFNNFNTMLKKEYLDKMEPYYIKKTHLKVSKFSIKMVLQHVFCVKIQRKTNFTVKIQAIK